MAVMTVLYVTDGPTGIDKVRAIDYEAGSYPFGVTDENYGRGSYRGQPYVRGVVFVEDVTSAAALQIATATDAAFTVVTAIGTGTVTIKGFRAYSYQAVVGDGTVGGQVVGYAVTFDGVLNTSITAQTAATHAAV